MSAARHLLWVDCTAAALAGASVLALNGWLSGLTGLPRELLLVVGVVNLLYAAFSFSLARRPTRPPHLIRVLVAANLAWAAACVVAAAYFLGTATVFGVGQLAGEGVFVAALAGAEWRFRDRLAAGV